MIEPHNDWNSWKRLVLDHLERMEKRLKEIEEKAEDRRIELAVIKTKLAMYSIVAAMLGSAFVSWLVDRMND